MHLVRKKTQTDEPAKIIKVIDRYVTKKNEHLGTQPIAEEDSYRRLSSRELLLDINLVLSELAKREPWRIRLRKKYEQVWREKHQK